MKQQYDIELRSGVTTGFADSTWAVSPDKAVTNIWWRWAERQLGSYASSMKRRLFISKRQNAGYEPFIKITASSSNLLSLSEFKKLAAPVGAPTPKARMKNEPKKPKIQTQLELPFEERLEKALKCLIISKC